MSSQISLIAIKVDFSFQFEPYLHLFNKETVRRILSYKFRNDQVVAFTSALLKFYYLAKYLKVSPKQLEIIVSQNGKPSLKPLPHISNVDFNISHSGEYVIMAISKNLQIGVDIEIINYDINPLELSSIICSDSEQILIQNIIKNFYIIWTKKEALLKALGVGFDSHKFFKTTKLNLEQYQEINDGTSYFINFKTQYYLSICCLPSKI